MLRVWASDGPVKDSQTLFTLLKGHCVKHVRSVVLIKRGRRFVILQLL